MKIVLTQKDVTNILEDWAQSTMSLTVKAELSFSYSNFDRAELSEIEDIDKEPEDNHG